MNFVDFLPATSKLSLNERTELVEYLLQSLEGQDDPEVERLWLEELERRLLELDEGKVETISSEEVFARLREDLALKAEPRLKRQARSEIFMSLEDIRREGLRLPEDERLDLVYAILRDLSDEGFEVDWEKLKVVERSEESRTPQP